MKATEEMQELITRSPIKSCPLDPKPSSFLVQIVDILLPVFTSMVNLSLMPGHIPEALLFPALKRVDLDVHLRTSGNLSFAFKL